MNIEQIMDALFDGYYNSTPTTTERADAYNIICTEPINELPTSNIKQLFNDGVRAESRQAFEYGFNAALTLMGGAK